jgi:hypothetical protein
MTEFQNPKQSAFDPSAADLDIVIWNLFVIWCLLFVISGLFRFSALVLKRFQKSKSQEQR